MCCSLSCQEGFSLDSPVFLPHQKPTIYKDECKIVNVGVVSVRVHLKNSHYVDEMQKVFLKSASTNTKFFSGLSDFTICKDSVQNSKYGSSECERKVSLFSKTLVLSLKDLQP